MTRNDARESPRFYVPDLDPGAAEVRLPEDEARHLTRVLRLTPGRDVQIFDGRGREYRARVTAARRGDVRVALIEPIARDTAPSAAFTLVQAVLKGTAMDDVVRDATMMGAAAVQPIVTAFTDVGGDVTARPAAGERWQRVAVASAKQCRRATLPAIAAPIPFDAWLAQASASRRFVLVEPSAAAGEAALTSFLAGPLGGSAELVVGPEGGWSPPELDAARARGCHLVSLGPLTLRAVAVPLAVMTLYVCAGQARIETNALRPDA